MKPLQIDKCVERFSREADLVAVWLFGSAANGPMREDSDVDFALHYRPGIKTDWAAIGELSCDLEAILGRKVDLGCLNSRDLVYAMQAIQTGRLVYSAHEKAAIAFASLLQSLYLDLKEDRKVVEDAYCA